MANREEIKQKIHDHEYYGNGFNHLSGRAVSVKNLRITKTKAVADIILHDYDENSKERFNQCEYPLEKLLK
jgi:hypothetical protein